MNRYLWAIVLALVPSAAFAQFADAPPAARGARGADEKNAAKGGAAVDPLGGHAAAPGGADMNLGGAAAAGAPQTNRMFDAIDTNGDGVISKTELAKAATSLKKLDIDGDGNITLAEATGPAGPVGQAANVNQMVDQTMALYDKNHDGKLTPDEMPPEMAANFHMADQNNDGVVNRPELAAAMEKMQNMFNAPGGGMRGGAMTQQQMGQQVLQSFMQYDRNGDGKLSADEVPPQLKGMLQGADRNGDGFIDPQELQAFMALVGQRGARGGTGVDPMGGRRGR